MALPLVPTLPLCGKQGLDRAGGESMLSDRVKPKVSSPVLVLNSLKVPTDLYNSRVRKGFIQNVHVTT